MKGDRWFYHPTQTDYAHPREFDLTFESVHFESDENLLHGWYFPAAGEPKGTVVHCHGNGGNVTGHFKYVAWMPARGWNVLCFDYRGYGRSQGTPSRPGTVIDTGAAIDFLYTRADVDPERIVLFGQSLGGAVGLAVAAERHDLRGVAIEGAFSSYRGAARYLCRRTWYLWAVARWIPNLLIDEGLDPIHAVDRLSPTPTFFITGTRDRICDPRQTIDLYEAAGDPKSLWTIEGGEHTGALTDTDGEGSDRLERFFMDCLLDRFPEDQQRSDAAGKPLRRSR